MSGEIDGNDVEILRALRRDSRMPMGAIGESIGVSKATVSRRVARMEADGVILGYSAEVSHSKIDVMKSLVSMQIVGNPVSVVIEQLRHFREIGDIYKTFGDHNIVCEIYTRSVDDLYDMIQTKLLKMPSVRNVEVDILVERMTINPSADLDLFASGLGEQMKD